MTLKLKKLKRNKKKGKKKIKFYLLANARITKCNAAFNTKIVSFWIKLSSEKADRMYRFFSSPEPSGSQGELIGWP